jgi:hypothetical protein
MSRRICPAIFIGAWMLCLTACGSLSTTSVTGPVVYQPMLADCNGGTTRDRRVWDDGRADDYRQP